MQDEETNPILEFPLSYGSLQPTIKRKSYFSVCFLYILYSLSFTLTIPAIPALTLHLTNNDAVHSSYIFGIASFLRYILEFFVSPLIGTIADAKGRKLVFLTAFLVNGLEYVLLGLFPSIPMLFLTRVISGLGDGGVSAGYAMITDIAIHNDDLVSQKYGMFGSMFGLAFIVGPFAGGLLCEIHVLWCFVAAFVIAMIGGGCTYFYLEETKHFKEDVRKRASSSAHTIIIEEPPHDTVASLDPLIGLKTHLSNSRICYLVIILACCTLTTGLHFIWYLYMSYVYHATPTEVGMYLSFHGILSAIAQGILLQVFIPDMISETYAAFFALFLACFYTLGISLCRYQWELYLVSFIACMHVIHYPAVKALIVNESLYSDVKSIHQGNLQGTIGSIRTLATAFGSLLFTTIFSWGILWEIPTIPFYVASFLYAIGSLLLLRYVVPTTASTATTAATTAAATAAAAAASRNTFEHLTDLIIASPTSPTALFELSQLLPTTTVSTTSTLSSPAAIPPPHPIGYQVELLEQTILSDVMSTLPYD